MWCTHSRDTAHHEIDCENTTDEFAVPKPPAPRDALITAAASGSEVCYSLKNSLGVFAFLTLAILTVTDR